MEVKLKVNGMSCGHCVSAVTRAIESIEPNANAQVDLASGAVCYLGTAEKVSDVIAAIEEEGFSASTA